MPSRRGTGGRHGRQSEPGTRRGSLDAAAAPVSSYALVSGLVDGGVDVALVHNQATLVRNGAPLVEHVGTDLTGLLEAEVAVAALVASNGEPSSELPASATLDAVAAIHRRLRVLALQWRDLDDGHAVSLTFPSW